MDAPDAQQYPWCGHWALKDVSFNYGFACGLADDGIFRVGAGCGRSWRWGCGRKLCGQYCEPQTGVKLPSGRGRHDAWCWCADVGFRHEQYGMLAIVQRDDQHTG